MGPHFTTSNSPPPCSAAVHKKQREARGSTVRRGIAHYNICSFFLSCVHCTPAPHPCSSLCSSLWGGLTAPPRRCRGGCKARRLRTPMTNANARAGTARPARCRSSSDKLVRSPLPAGCPLCSSRISNLAQPAVAHYTLRLPGCSCSRWERAGVHGLSFVVLDGARLFKRLMDLGVPSRWGGVSLLWSG